MWNSNIQEEKRNLILLFEFSIKMTKRKIKIEFLWCCNCDGRKLFLHLFKKNSFHNELFFSLIQTHFCKFVVKRSFFIFWLRLSIIWIVLCRFFFMPTETNGYLLLTYLLPAFLVFTMNWMAFCRYYANFRCKWIELCLLATNKLYSHIYKKNNSKLP